MTLLFATRLLVYLVAIAIPIVHPAVTISYDRVGWVTWFALVPLEMALAAFLKPPRMRLPYWLAAALGLAVVAAVAGPGLDTTSLTVIGVGLAAFVLTALVFHGREHGHLVAAAELLFVGYVLLKLLRFSRANDVIAEESLRITTVLVVMITCGFLLHALALYLAAFPESGGRVRRRELVMFVTFALPVSIALGVLLPLDFVSNRIAFNNLNEVARPEPQPIGADSSGPPGGNLRPLDPLQQEQNQGQGGQGEQTDAGGQGGQGEDEQNQQDGQGEGEQSERQQRLEGIPAERWNDSEAGAEGGGQGEQGQAEGGGQGQDQGEEGEGEGEEGDGDGEGRQFARMVIASATDPVYAADGYFADLHPEGGFSYSIDEPLNELVNQRLLTTWVDVLRLPDRRREQREYFFLSSITDRVMPYRPYTIEPTVMDRLYHPFDLSYWTVSRVSATGPDQWRRLGDLSPIERNALAPYLEVPLSDETLARFEQYAAEVTAGAAGYYDKIDAILRSFDTCQYEIGFTDDVSVDHLELFLFETRSGDCTEFSNTSAILGRMLGIPTRVVTGYLGSESLQTPQHARGAAVLRQSIEPLQAYPLEDLYLITTAHRHSWTQFWLPDYGWVDFETTTHAKTPPPGMDANSLDIVIPIIEVEEVPVPRDFVFPWRFALTVLATLTAVGIAGAYGLRYGREGWLSLRARNADAGGLRALGSLLYMRMASAGCALKPHAHTAQEYARQYPEIGRFAALYTMLRYRTAFAPGEQSSTWQELRAQYQTALKGVRKGGLVSLLRRTFSLRALYY
jgi:transglutaminase-like putative cysteine protease